MFSKVKKVTICKLPKGEKVKKTKGERMANTTITE